MIENERIGKIDRVTGAKRGDEGRIFGRKTVEEGVAEFNKITDMREKSNSRHWANGQNQRRLTRNMV